MKPSVRPKTRSACDYCRLKKAKCDEKKPCSNCSKKGIQCSYNPEEVIVPSKMDKGFNSLAGKLDALDQKLASLISIVSPDTLEVTPDLYQSPLPIAAVGPRSTNSEKLKTKSLMETEIFTEDDNIALIMDDLLPLFNPGKNQSFDTTINEAIDHIEAISNDSSNSISSLYKLLINENFDIDSKDPYLISFLDSTPNLLEDSNNLLNQNENKMDISSMVDNITSGCHYEMHHDHVLLSAVQMSILKEEASSFKGRLDLSFLKVQNKLSIRTRYAEELLESYLEHIYPFFPIVCEATVSAIKKEVYEEGLILSACSCQYFLLLALGELSLSSENEMYWNERISFETDKIDRNNCLKPAPGYGYFWCALSMIERIFYMYPNGFETITIQLLVSVYYLKVCQLNELRYQMIRGSEMLFAFLELEGNKHKHRDILLRLYWVFLHLERELHSLDLLEKPSSLFGIQKKVAIPRGCKTNFPKDADTFYSNCYMQNILLSNINNKVKNLQNTSRKEPLPFDDCFKMYIKFGYELDIWRKSLPFSFQWEDDITIRCTHVEMDLLKMKYYLVFVTICEFVITHFERNLLPDHVDRTFEAGFRNVDMNPKLYANQVEILVQKALSFTAKAETLFSRQMIADLDPFLSIHLINSLYFLFNSKSCIGYESKYFSEYAKLRKNFKSCLPLLNCFAMHSVKIDENLNVLRNFLC